MQLSQIKGLKFPDEFLIRAFFKEQLFKKKGDVIEFGSGNGNNLSMFFQYGWNVTGVDVDEKSIQSANANFSILSKECIDTGNYQFAYTDMVHFQDSKKYNAILFPGSLLYLTKANCLLMLGRLPEMISDNGAFCYFKMRTPNDYRIGISKLLDDGFTREILSDETSEKGCRMTFWDVHDFITEINKHCILSDVVTLNLQYDNLQKGVIINNSDFILWGYLLKRQNSNL